MKRLSFLTKSLALVALAFLAVCAGIAALQVASERQALQVQALRDLDAAKSGYEALEADELRLMGANLDRLAQDPALRSAYLARDRARLLSLARPQYQGLKDRYEFSHFNFVDPPPASTCFLRLQDPASFGDKITRRTYRLAVANGGFGEGKELGETAFALRSVRAWRSADGKQVIGYLELGEEIGRFLGELKARTGNDFALLLDKRYLDPMRWLKACHAQGRPSDWSDRPVYVLADNTGVLAKQLQWNGVLADLPLDGKVLGMERVGQRVIVTGVFPVDDALDRLCGAMLVARDVTPLMQQGRTAYLVAEALALLAVLFLGFLAGWLLAHGDAGSLSAALARLWRR